MYINHPSVRSGNNGVTSFSSPTGVYQTAVLTVQHEAPGEVPPGGYRCVRCQQRRRSRVSRYVLGNLALCGPCGDSLSEAQRERYLRESIQFQLPIAI